MSSQQKLIITVAILYLIFLPCFTLSSTIHVDNASVKIHTYGGKDTQSLCTSEPVDQSPNYVSRHPKSFLKFLIFNSN